jgi:hypothetical protein
MGWKLLTLLISVMVFIGLRIIADWLFGMSLITVADVQGKISTPQELMMEFMFSFLAIGAAVWWHKSKVGKGVISVLWLVSFFGMVYSVHQPENVEAHRFSANASIHLDTAKTQVGAFLKEKAADEHGWAKVTGKDGEKVPYFTADGLTTSGELNITAGHRSLTIGQDVRLGSKGTAKFGGEMFFNVVLAMDMDDFLSKDGTVKKPKMDDLWVAAKNIKVVEVAPEIKAKERVKGVVQSQRVHFAPEEVVISKLKAKRGDQIIYAEMTAPIVLENGVTGATVSVNHSMEVKANMDGEVSFKGGEKEGTVLIQVIPRG